MLSGWKGVGSFGDGEASGRDSFSMSDRMSASVQCTKEQSRSLSGDSVRLA